jgi:hypothetical protein
MTEKPEITPKYSEMLMEIYDIFDDQLPESLTMEDVVECCIDAWNLANNKEMLGEVFYKKELKAYKHNDVIEKMVEYKNIHFINYNSVIVDFSIENDILSVKCQTIEGRFNSLLSSVINTQPDFKTKRKK